MRLITFVAALLLQSPIALACGYCIEDKIATVYDHAVVTSALTAKHSIAFFAIEGTLAMTDQQRQTIERLVRLSRGIDPGSARISVESAALSIAFDPARVSLEDVHRSLQHNFARKHLSLQLLRVMDTPAELKTVPVP